MESPDLNATLKETLEIFDSPTPQTTTDVAEILDIGRRAAYDRLDRLVARDLIRTKSVGARARVWWHPDPQSTRGSIVPNQPRCGQPLENELEKYLGRITDGFFALNPSWKFAFANEQAAQLFGTTTAELIGESFWDVFPELEQSDIGAQYRAALESQQARSFEQYVETVDMWANVNVYPSPSGLSVYFQDITKRRSAMSALRERERRYRDLFNSISEGFSVIERVETNPVDFQYIEANPAFRTLTGIDSIVGRRMREVDVPNLESWIAAFDNILSRDEAVRFEREISDSGTYLDCFAFPVGEPDEAQLGIIFTDITERKQYARELERRQDQQQQVAELAQFALDHESKSDVISRAISGVLETLDHDVACVLAWDGSRLEMRDCVGDPVLLKRIEEQCPSGETSEERPDLDSVQRHFAHWCTSPACAGELSSIIGTTETSWGLLWTATRRDREYSDETQQYVQTVANIIASAVHRQERQEVLRGQHAELSAVKNLHEVVSEITRVVVDQTTRTEIQQTVCDVIADTDAYEFALVGEIDASTNELVTQAVGGETGYADDVMVSLDSEHPQAAGPGARAIREKEIQVCQDVFTDPRFEPWRAAARTHGFSAVASIPIVHEETVYGVLALYAERNAFDDTERSIVSQLGEVMGYAIAATERKRALMSDEHIKLELRVPAVFDAYGTPFSLPGMVTMHHAVSTSGDDFLVYGTATHDTLDVLDELVSVMPHWENVRVLTEGEVSQIEVKSSSPPVFAAIANSGGYVASTVYEGSDMNLTLHLAPHTNVHHVVALIEEQFGEANLISRTQISHDRDDLHRTTSQLMTTLTDRQRAVIDAAYYAGYYRWPRASSGKDIATALGIAPATFSQHLRKAEQKVMDGIYPEFEH